MPAFSRIQLVLLAVLTVIWGVNWPILKIGIADFPPLSFRVLSFWVALPLFALVLVLQKVPLALPRAVWRSAAWLTFWNMVCWNILMILAVPRLSSGRAAILGYTMPIFSAIIGSLFFRDRLALRAWSGVLAAGAGVLLLLWNEMERLSGSVPGVALMLAAATTWALGTQLLRRWHVPVALLTLTFWMVLATTLILSTVAWLFEADRWHIPNGATIGAAVYNGVLALAFGQTAWFFLARTLAPIASTLSVMMIPLIGVFSGAWWLNETLHWQDWSAMALIVLAIATVLWPARKR